MFNFSKDVVFGSGTGVKDSFEKEVGQDRGALVELYTPWYAHLILYILSYYFHEIRWLLFSL